MEQTKRTMVGMSRYNFVVRIGDPPPEEIFSFIPCRSSELRLSSQGLRIIQRFNFSRADILNFGYGLRAFEADFCLESLGDRADFLNFWLEHAKGKPFWTLYPFAVGRLTADVNTGDTVFKTDAILSPSFSGYIALWIEDEVSLFKPISFRREGNSLVISFGISVGIEAKAGTRIFVFSRFKFTSSELTISYGKVAVAKSVKIREFPPELQIAP
jgi:hypothetical protein